VRHPTRLRCLFGLPKRGAPCSSCHLQNPPLAVAAEAAVCKASAWCGCCSCVPGDVKDVGYGKGKYYSLNVPLSDGIDDDSYQFIFKPLITEVCHRVLLYTVTP